MKIPKKLRLEWLITFLLTALFLLMHVSGFQPLASLESKSYDLRQRMRQHKPVAPIVIIAVDDQSIVGLGRWPWPRSYMAELIDFISNGKPSLIALNVLYTEPERNAGLEEIREIRKKLEIDGKAGGTFLSVYDSLLSAEQKLDSDAALAKSLLQAKNVFLPLFVAPGAQSDGDRNFPPLLLKNSLNATPVSLSFSNAVEESLPIEPLLEAALGIGHFNLFQDGDGVVRSEALFVHYKGHLLPSLPLRAALHYSGVKLGDVGINAGRIDYAGKSIPIDAKGKMLMDYRGKFGTFPYYSYIDVVSGRVPSETFKNKIVLIGTIATGIASFETTPPQAAMPGIEITANAIDTIISGSYISKPSFALPIEIFMLLAIALFLVFAMQRMKAGTGALVVLAIIFAWNGIAIWFFSSKGIWFAMVAPTLLLVLGYTAVVSIRFVKTEKKKDMVETDSMETSKMLGLSFQSQGLLDLAFEKFRKCPINDETTKDILYNLALDFERKRMFNKASAVYEHILTAGDFKDIKERIHTLKQANETMIFGGTGARKEATVMLNSGSTELPTIGRFEIQKELGHGAMGTVYLGKDPKINRMVAIKTIRFDELDASQAADAKQRFFREAQAAGALNHPNIVTIYDAGEDYDLGYVAMELLDGSDLCDYVKTDKKLPYLDVLRIVAQVADGLDFAHAKGIVHRDIKPANIMRLKGGEIKIADFGIARITASSATQTGTLLGTPSYMSPEQVRGEKVDGRSDLFSLGVVMYELLSCRKPFTGDSITGIMFNIVNKPPLLVTKIDADIPECCAYIAHKMLIKDLAKRYQSGREIAEHCRVCMQKLGAK